MKASIHSKIILCFWLLLINSTTLVSETTEIDATNIPQPINISGVSGLILKNKSNQITQLIIPERENVLKERVIGASDTSSLTLEALNLTLPPSISIPKNMSLDLLYADTSGNIHRVKQSQDFGPAKQSPQIIAFGFGNMFEQLNPSTEESSPPPEPVISQVRTEFDFSGATFIQKVFSSSHGPAPEEVNIIMEKDNALKNIIIRAKSGTLLSFDSLSITPPSHYDKRKTPLIITYIDPSGSFKTALEGEVIDKVKTARKIIGIGSIKNVYDEYVWQKENDVKQCRERKGNDCTLYSFEIDDKGHRINKKAIGWFRILSGKSFMKNFTAEEAERGDLPKWVNEEKCAYKSYRYHATTGSEPNDLNGFFKTQTTLPATPQNDVGTYTMLTYGFGPDFESFIIGVNDKHHRARGFEEIRQIQSSSTNSDHASFYANILYDQYIQSKIMHNFDAKYKQTNAGFSNLKKVLPKKNTVVVDGNEITTTISNEKTIGWFIKVNKPSKSIIVSPATLSIPLQEGFDYKKCSLLFDHTSGVKRVKHHTRLPKEYADGIEEAIYGYGVDFENFFKESSPVNVGVEDKDGAYQARQTELNQFRSTQNDGTEFTVKTKTNDLIGWFTRLPAKTIEPETFVGADQIEINLPKEIDETKCILICKYQSEIGAPGAVFKVAYGSTIPHPPRHGAVITPLLYGFGADIEHFYKNDESDISFGYAPTLYGHDGLSKNFTLFDQWILEGKPEETPFFPDFDLLNGKAYKKARQLFDRESFEFQPILFTSRFLNNIPHPKEGISDEQRIVGHTHIHKKHGKVISWFFTPKKETLAWLNFFGGHFPSANPIAENFRGNFEDGQRAPETRNASSLSIYRFFARKDLEDSDITKNKSKTFLFFKDTQNKILKLPESFRIPKNKDNPATALLAYKALKNIETYGFGSSASLYSITNEETNKIHHLFPYYIYGVRGKETIKKGYIAYDDWLKNGKIEPAIKIAGVKIKKKRSTGKKVKDRMAKIFSFGFAGKW